MPSTPTLFNDNGFHSIKLKMCLILLPATFPSSPRAACSRR